MLEGKVGVAVGKYLPPHRGHISAIINAATQVEKLYVVVSDNAEVTRLACEEAGIKEMPLKLRAKWLSQELQGFSHIRVVMLDESKANIPVMPNGWEPWSLELARVVEEPINVIFGGEPSYTTYYKEYFPNAKYILYDCDRNRYPISGTEIRKSPLKYWNYILGSARPFFAKKVLLAGSESCGKTTLTKYLAKLYYTSWSEEYGRYYADEALGGNEEVYSKEDFYNIALQQTLQDTKALSSANRVCFFDTDPVVTQFYCKKFLGSENPEIEKFIDPNKYDLILLLSPDVPWVADGVRQMGEMTTRWVNHNEILGMYTERKFGPWIEELTGSYHERLERAMWLVDTLIN